MRPLSRFAAGLSLVALLAAAAAAERLPPAAASCPIRPTCWCKSRIRAACVETVTNLDALKQLQQFPSVKELLDSTTSRRYYQFLAYFEKELGADRLELLDRLAGGGAVLATKFGADPRPALLVVQGKDEKLMKKFVAAALDVLEQELARQDVKERPVKETYEGVETVRFGKDFHAAVAGPDPARQQQREGVASRPRPPRAANRRRAWPSRRRGRRRQAAAGRPARQLWLNMETVKQQPGVKDFYNVPRDIRADGPLRRLPRTRWAARRSSALASVKDKDGLLLTARMPRGRDGMGGGQRRLPAAGGPARHPAAAGAEGRAVQRIVLPRPGALLERPDQAVQRQQVKAMEEADKNSGKFLSGLQLSKLLTQAGPTTASSPSTRRRPATRPRRSSTSPPSPSSRDARPGGVRRNGDGVARRRPVRARRRSS